MKEGMYLQNVKLARAGKELDKRRNGSKYKQELCLKCKGFYSKSYMRRYKILCGSTRSQSILESTVFDLLDDSADTFFTEVIEKFHKDEIGLI